MIKKLPFENILFLDIETVSESPDYQALPDTMRALWRQKGERFARTRSVEWSEEVAAETYDEKAGIFAEFGKVVVISVGFLFTNENGEGIKTKSIIGPDERSVLHEFSDLLVKYYNNPARHILCGHNIKEFDIPYLCRRMIITGLPLPDIINVTGKKPWETVHLLDTMELWKFGDFKNYTSLNLLANILGLPTPKDDIDGSDVGRVFWQENDIQRIARYCEKDVITVVQLLRRFQGLEPIPDSQLISVSNFGS